MKAKSPQFQQNSVYIMTTNEETKKRNYFGITLKGD